MAEVLSGMVPAERGSAEEATRVSPPWDWKRLSALARAVRVGGRGLWLPLAILLSGVLLQRLAAQTPWMTERIYARGVYPWLLASISSFSRSYGFSVGEALTGLLL